MLEILLSIILALLGPRTFHADIQTMQGVAYDGDHVYISQSKRIYKYHTGGVYTGYTYLDNNTHYGDLVVVGDYVYIASSHCDSGGQSTFDKIEVFDLKLNKVTEHDIGAYFTTCAGAVAYRDGKYYVAESFYDSTNFDRIVVFDDNFEYIETKVTSHKSNWGIQGLDYVESMGMWRIQSHGTGYYYINADFENSSIQTETAGYSLQGIAYAGNGKCLTNNRASRQIILDDC
jgi:hypothetical protein